MTPSFEHYQNPTATGQIEFSSPQPKATYFGDSSFPTYNSVELQAHAPQSSMRSSGADWSTYIETNQATIYSQQDHQNSLSRPDYKEDDYTQDASQYHETANRKSTRETLESQASQRITLDEESTKQVVSELVRALSTAPQQLRSRLAMAGLDVGIQDVLSSVNPLRQRSTPTTPTSPTNPSGTEGLLKEISDFQTRQSVSYGTRDKIRRSSMYKPPSQETDVKTKGKFGSNFRATLFKSAQVSNLIKGFGGKVRSGSITPLSSLKRMKPNDSVLKDLNELNDLKKGAQRNLQEQDMSSAANPVEDSAYKQNNYSESELRKLYPDLWESFRRYDMDGNGTVSCEELGNYLEVELGSEIALEDIQKFFEAIDANGDGSVSFKELADWYHSIVNSLEMNTGAQHGVTVGRIFDVTKFHIGDIAKSIRNPGLANATTGTPLVEFEDWEPESNWIIHPYSTFHITWDLSISAILIITVISLPLSLAFENLNDHMASFNLAVDVIFCLDIVKNFFTGYCDADGITHLHKSDVITHYLWTWFFPDLVSSFPIDVIISHISGVEEDALTRSTKTLKLIRLVRIAKLVRILRMGRAAKYFSFWRRFLEDKLKVRIHDSTMRMVKLGMLLLVLAHWIGCLQFMMCRVMDFPESSWVVMSGLKDKSEGQQYMWAFFKALGQMIGIGFETPPITNLNCSDLDDSWCAVEMWITLGSMYLGSVFYAIMISNISSIIFSMNMASRLYQEKTQQLNEYMRSKRLPPPLRDRVRDYFALRYSEGKIFNEEAIMKDLSPSLRRDIMIFTSRELFLKVPFFRDCTGNGFISSLATSLTPMVAFQDDIIIEEGTTGDSMFFISSGKILIYVEEFTKEDTPIPNSNSSSKRVPKPRGNSSTVSEDDSWLAPKLVPIASISAGSFFGEVSLVLPVRRTASAKATAVSILYMLDRDALLTALKDFPDIFSRLRDIATSRVRRVTKKLRARATQTASGHHRKTTRLSLERDLQDVEAVALNKQKSQ